MSQLQHDPGPGEAPPFGEPWQARAFALTLALHEKGLFSWAEWTAALSREIAADEDAGSSYYQIWLQTLEKLVAAREG